MAEHNIAIRFPELELAAAGRAASDLRAQLLDDVPDADVHLAKDDPTTQDFGATLIAVIGTPAALALARGIAAWIARKRTTIVIERTGDTTRVTASGTIDENTARIVEALGSG